MNRQSLSIVALSGSFCMTVGFVLGYTYYRSLETTPTPQREASEETVMRRSGLEGEPLSPPRKVEELVASEPAEQPGEPRSSGAAPVEGATDPEFDYEAFRDGLRDGNFELPSLSVEEIEAALEAAGRPSHSLVAAAQMVEDPELAEQYLEEALEKSPDSPAVLASAAAWFLGQEDPPDRLDDVLDHLREVDPTNSFGSYLAAARLSEAGEIDRALEMVKEAGTRTQFHSYVATTVDAAEQLFLRSGYAPVLARSATVFGARVDYLMPMRGLSESLVGHLDTLQGPGRDREGLALLSRANRLGEHLSLGGRTMIDELIGMSVQAHALEREREIQVRLRDDARVAWIDEHLENNRLYKQEVQRLAGQLPGLVAAMGEDELLTYFDRVMKSGELVAIREYLARQGGQ
ncbi:MAG: hypothetical protein AAF488_05320 [Planctomycetota bacterium]